MRSRKVLAIPIFFTMLCFVIYLTMDLKVFPTKRKSIDQEYHDNKWLHFENKLKMIEREMSKNNRAVGEIKEAIQNMLPTPQQNVGDIPDFPSEAEEEEEEEQQQSIHKLFPASEMIYETTCPLQVNYAPTTDIQMLDMYKELTFDNPDGGVWKQGWQIRVHDGMWNKQHKLKVYVVPHSHNDPGWIKTFEEYYFSQTKHILDNMVEKLPEDPRRKFIWAEISFFAMWWDVLEPSKKKVVQKLIKTNQLEFVTGGWVMNDEANSHWVSVIQQLTEGHQWLQKNLNYTPVSHWSIDPFGYSATQAALMKGIGLKNMLIHRVHYSVKKQLAMKKQLEFNWRQTWDGKGDTDLFTHMMPFYSYDIPHTCGPDPKICCQFDFKRLPSHGLTCPWKVPPQIITESNVAKKALLLLDQYRKKSTLYKTNIVLAPLGDDFRYDHSTEWDVQYQNYQKLMDYMNSKLNLFVQIQFGTLTDYFNAVRAEKKTSEFPTLSGDFFTYADRDDHYWSGYYTSRPFYKRMDRILLYYLRASEIILTLAHISGKPGSRWIADKDIGLDKSMSEARRALALFQHHDGITGTAKDHVVNDYGQKMLDAILNCQNVLQKCANLLLSGPGADIQGSDTVFYNVDDFRQSQDTLPEQHTITIGPQLSTKRVVVFNSLTFTRHEVVTFIVSTPHVEVWSVRGESGDKRVKCQVSPVFEHVSTMSNSKYRVSFIANVPALGLVTYIINAVTEDSVPEETVQSSVKIFNQYAEVQTPPGFVNMNIYPSSSEFTIQNARVTASFNNLGLLKAIKVGTTTTPVHLDFAKYGVRHSVERSGAYLFLPDGEPTAIKVQNTVVKVIEGPILSTVFIEIPYIQHKVTLYNTPGGDSLGLEIENLVDIKQTSNFEIIMRLSTNINNTNEFYTDINAYQIMKRKKFKKLPIQANYYPMPSSVYIEDGSTRLTVLTGSPVGTSSFLPGQLEMMLDRRLMQDDNLGVGQGVMDNHPTRHIFRLILERKTHKCQTTADNHPSGFLTLSAHVALETLLNPLVRLLRTEDEDMISHPAYLPGKTDFGVDFTMPTFRTGVTVQGKDYVGLMLHRVYLDVCFTDRVLLQQFPMSQGLVNISAILPSTATSNLKLNRASLTFLHMGDSMDVQKDLSLCPMDTQAFLLHR